MAQLLDLFKSQRKELYGKSENIRIESRGIINPPRAAALIASSPNAIADLIGTNVAGLIKGSANRPSDTIFGNNKVFSKPLSITGVTTAQLRDVIEDKTEYFVKKSPMPNVVGGFKQGASNTGGAAANLLIKTANAYGSVKKIKKLLKNLKEKGPVTLPDNPEQYGTKFMPDTKKGSGIINEKKLFSTHYLLIKDGKLKKREGAELTTWDIQESTINTLPIITDVQLKEAENAGHVVVSFAKIIDDTGKTTNKVPFIGTVTDISEDIQPEWTNFRHIGSPFKVNRYLGVERNIKFNLKLYYTTFDEKQVMIKKINYLKSLAFPDSNVVTSKFGDNNQYAIAPNIIKFSIGSFYKNVAGYLESISFSIDENTTWAKMGKDGNNDITADNNDDNFMYPSIIDVSIGIKIIETHSLESKEGSSTKTYKYNFDGLNEAQTYTIKEADMEEGKPESQTKQ